MPAATPKDHGQPGVHENHPPSYGVELPVINQPTAQGGPPANWMPMPAGIPPNCPPGLEYLSMIDQLLVHQKIELFEAITGFETKNKFKIRNTLGQDVYYAAEDSDCLVRYCCGQIRPFDMKILDNYKTEVIHFYRPLACQGCCFPCCLQSMEVSAPPGTILGTIQQEWSIFYPTFAVKDANGDTILRIEGPFFTCSCCCNDVEFRITSADGKTDVGKITKQWSGVLREAFTDADNFSISFPLDLDVKMKAVLMGGLFLIDIMFFERSGNN
ncbi:hypothetical protein Zmor_001194 [Zophobas morio]|uniref:Phospholipid scramblase n=1 Tax=Zophobas morio TaxID=2755281 RepID=A0AA38J6K3_9CUCU|nr:hypothetical protein Zmor_001194 [Zophobas morio]